MVFVRGSNTGGFLPIYLFCIALERYESCSILAPSGEGGRRKPVCAFVKPEQTLERVLSSPTWLAVLSGTLLLHMLDVKRGG